MPRGNGRGGPRQGAPGAQYPNRTDLAKDRQPVRAVPNQTYGERGAQEAAQKAIPLPVSAPPPPLDAPTGRPDEPLTAGMPMGAGAGPEALAAPAGLGPGDDTLAVLKKLYQTFGDPDIGRLIYEKQSRPVGSAAGGGWAPPGPMRTSGGMSAGRLHTPPPHRSNPSDASGGIPIYEDRS